VTIPAAKVAMVGRKVELADASTAGAPVAEPNRALEPEAPAAVVWIGRVETDSHSDFHGDYPIVLRTGRELSLSLGRNYRDSFFDFIERRQLVKADSICLRHHLLTANRIILLT
jgi:hypothetical protein